MSVEKEAIYEIIPRDKVVVPKVPFQKFYKKFRYVRDLVKTSEWKDAYSQFYSFGEDELEIDISEEIDELESYDLEKQTEEFIKCANSFSYFAHKYARIIHPMYGLIPAILFRYQKRVILNFEQERFNIISSQILSINRSLNEVSSS